MDDDKTLETITVIKLVDFFIKEKNSPRTMTEVLNGTKKYLKEKMVIFTLWNKPKIFNKTFFASTNCEVFWVNDKIYQRVKEIQDYISEIESESNSKEPSTGEETCA